VTATFGDTGVKIEAATDGNGALSYAVKSGDAVTVDETNGALDILKVGTAVITVSAAETAEYTAATKDVTVTVNAKDMTVSAENVDATADGQPHGITVNVTDPATGATVKYGTTEGTYDLDECPTQTEAGTLTVYYQVTAENYNAFTGSATVTVSAAPVVKPTQTITANDMSVTFGVTGKRVKARTSGDGTLSYALKSGDAVTVDPATGELTIVSVGTAVITVTAAETDNYAAATKDVTVTVMQVPAIPGDIDGDGEANAKDVTILRRNLAGGYGVELSKEVADLNKDGYINAKDVSLLRRFLAGGYGVTLS
jgi:hypothetical protein